MLVHRVPERFPVILNERRREREKREGEKRGKTERMF